MTVVSNSECGGNLMLLTYSNDITQVSVGGNNGFVHTESSQIITTLKDECITLDST